jgi:hypothetical protein
MAYGKIVADQIQHSSEGTVGTQYVVSGSAKALLVYDNTGTATTLNSLNISSVNDFAVGQLTPTFSNSFSDTNYTYAGAAYCGGGGSAINPAMAASTYGSAPAITSSAVSLAYEDVDGAYTDYDKNTVIFHGDLA